MPFLLLVIGNFFPQNLESFASFSSSFLVLLWYLIFCMWSISFSLQKLLGFFQIPNVLKFHDDISSYVLALVFQVRKSWGCVSFKQGSGTSHSLVQIEKPQRGSQEACSTGLRWNTCEPCWSLADLVAITVIETRGQEDLMCYVRGIWYSVGLFASIMLSFSWALLV